MRTFSFAALLLLILCARNAEGAAIIGIAIKIAKLTAKIAIKAAKKAIQDALKKKRREERRRILEAERRHTMAAEAKRARTTTERRSNHLVEEPSVPEDLDDLDEDLAEHLTQYQIYHATRSSDIENTPQAKVFDAPMKIPIRPWIDE